MMDTMMSDDTYYDDFVLWTFALIGMTTDCATMSALAYKSRQYVIDEDAVRFGSLARRATPSFSGYARKAYEIDFALELPLFVDRR